MERYINTTPIIGTETNDTNCISGPGGVLNSPYLQAIIYLMYSGIFLAALLGNGLVCYVVHSSPRMRTVTNLFIVNLAVGDILMTLFCVPFSFVPTLLLQYWPFGATLCKTFSFSQVAAVLVSAYTLVAISMDRYMAIMWPLKPRLSKRQAKLVIMIVWLIAVVTAFPSLLVSGLYQPLEIEDIRYKQCDRYLCKELWSEWSDAAHENLYSLTLLLLQYLIPLTVLIFTYTSIAIVVWGKHPPGEAENTRDVRMARSKRKMIKMMLTVVVVFTVCWLPFNMLLILHDKYQTELQNWQHMPYFWFACHWLAMSHTCYNPVIYCWMNSRFRAGFCAALGRVPNASLRRANTSSTYLSVRRKTDHALREDQI
ncbi:RYamide receptor-like [Lycorma delicatula]|uniref:RYamide receptor-like n=1 Tax=Lycorma delicatula TaxID=130591 RepID=UPI003F518280